MILEIKNAKIPNSIWYIKPTSYHKTKSILTCIYINERNHISKTNIVYA